LIVVLACVLCCPLAAHSGSAGSLAAEHPDAAVFRQMARRGGCDFAAQVGRLPRSLGEIQDGGYSAYLFPTNWQPDFRPDEQRLVIGCLGHPAYFAGEFARSYDVVVTLPHPGLYEDVPRATPMAAAGAGRSQIVERHWNFPGAQWLYAGLGWGEVEAALRRQRVLTHLNWMTYEYDRGLGQMPQSLADLEDYLGTQRNPLCWQGIQEVAGPEAVDWQPGNLFVGWDHGAWLVSINLGPASETWRWVPGRDGHYSPGRGLAY
jgi:hypothetical protein